MLTNKSIAIATVSVLLLSACGHKKDLIIDREPIYISTSSCKAPPEFEPIVLPIADIDAKTENSDVAKKYAATIEMLKGEIKRRDEVLNGYRKKQDGEQKQPAESSTGKQATN